MMQRTHRLLKADFISEYLSRSRQGVTWDGGLTESEHMKYTPQMAMRGSPYPKFPGKWGIPKATEAIPPRTLRDWAVAVPGSVDRQLKTQYQKDTETSLPGVLWTSELPQDPVDRLFFQVKDENAELLQTGGNPDNPNGVFEHAFGINGGKDNPHYMMGPLPHMCTALERQDERRERFITVLTSPDTKAVARLLLDNGFIAGLRDYNNNLRFSIETKWFDNTPAIRNMRTISNPTRKATIHWDFNEINKVMYFNKVYNVIRLYILRDIDSGELMTHPEAFRRRLRMAEPVCFVD
eukprot:TRINITY_DN25480_c0_g1_i1.p1 TRINITY_DN25480_c0_g1~~TRINITY_DN25480_c0_g1_i1.p1  ORF type:complete len:294 (+),score=42.76 TRINITY_DN25480_c0_g1_i1:58-939(+)